MTLILRPPGRGNWQIVTVQITGERAAPLLVKLGDSLPIGGVTYRVVEVRA